MSDDLSPTEVSPQLGMSRRDLIRRGAILGGTLVWAAPAVQTFARPAFGQDTNGTPLKGVSFVAAVVVCDGEYFRVKANLNQSTGQFIWECDPGPEQHVSPQCPEDTPANWTGAEPVAGGDPTDGACSGALGISVTTTEGSDGKIDTVTLCLPATSDCNFVEGVAGVVFEGGECTKGTNGGNCLTFDGPF